MSWRGLATKVNPDVTVVICTRNRPASLERCLQSLAGVDYPSYGILVVDNAPIDDRTKLLADRFGAGYRLASEPGLSKARNAGLKAAPTDFVAYLDDDMVVHTKWLASLISQFGDGEIAAATGPVLSLELAGASDATIRDIVPRRPWGGEPLKLSRRSHEWFERAMFGGIGDGNFALHRTRLQWWRGFEERVGRGRPIAIGEDHLAFFEFIERGFAVAYSPDAIVFHPGHAEDVKESISQDLAFACFLAIKRPDLAAGIGRFLLRGSVGAHRSWRTWTEARLSERTTASAAGQAMTSAARLLWRTWRRE